MAGSSPCCLHSSQRGGRRTAGSSSFASASEWSSRGGVGVVPLMSQPPESTSVWTVRAATALRVVTIGHVSSATQSSAWSS